MGRDRREECGPQQWLTTEYVPQQGLATESFYRKSLKPDSLIVGPTLNPKPLYHIEL